MIALEDWQALALAGIVGLCIMGSVTVFFSIRNNAPDAFTHWKAARNGSVICRVHYRGGKVKDYIGEIDKDEKGMGTNYWKVPDVGEKFKPTPDQIEFIEGSIPCVNYFENAMPGTKLNEIVAYLRLKNYFNKKGISTEGIEKDAFFVLAETEKLNSDDAHAIANTKIKSSPTRKYLLEFLEAAHKNEAELKTLRNESGLFSYQTAIKAIDTVVGFNSASFSHAKEVIIAAALRKEEDRGKKFMEYAIIAVILAIAGVILLYGLKGL